MKTYDIFIAHPKTEEQVNALRAFMTALKIKFEISNEKTYNPTFVNMVMNAENDIKAGKGKKVSSEEFDSLWK